MVDKNRRITAWKVIGGFLVSMAALTACGGGYGGEAPLAASAPFTAPLPEPLALQVNASNSGLANEAMVVNVSTAGEQKVQGLGSSGDAGSAVAWFSQTDADATPKLYVQRYGPLGTRLGGETLIPFNFDDARVSTGSKPAVATTADGSIVVAYASNRLISSSATSYIESSGIYSQRFDQSGTPVGGETTVYSFVRQLVSARQVDSAVAPVVLSWPDGSYLVGWDRQHDLGYLGIHRDFQTQRFDPQGAPVGEPVSFSGGGDRCASFRATATPTGGYIVARTYCAAGDRYEALTVIDSKGSAIGEPLEVAAGAMVAPAPTLVR